MVREVALEELKRRWLKEAVVFPDPKRDLYSGRKPRREEDVLKLAELAKLMFQNKFEVNGRTLKMMFLSRAPSRRS